MQIIIKKINGLVIPSRATPNDAAYDITAVSEPNIVGVKFEIPLDGINAWSKIDYIEYKTNLFIAPQDEIVPALTGGHSSTKYQKFHTLLLPRSSISKKNLVLANSVGLIDNGYRGEILLRFKYIMQPEDMIIVPEAGRQRIYCILNPSNVYGKGDKIAQIMAQPNVEITFLEAEQLDDTVRGSGGFGSTN